jgi:hypothetical protein
MTTDPIQAADLNSCFIQIEHGGDLVLAILLARDGSINRMGDGTPSPADNTLYIGVVKEPLFDQLMEVVPDDLFRYVSRLELPDREGVDTTISVMFQHDDGRVLPFEVLFGSESAGVPLELQTILRRALELSDAWWNGQRGVSQGTVPPRPDV